MCRDHSNNQFDQSHENENEKEDGKHDHYAPPDPSTIPLPPSHILSHLTDAHCHPTDTPLSSRDYDDFELGGIAAMATTVDDQSLVDDLGRERAWKQSDWKGNSPSVRIVSCFGYHPWFVHRYYISSPSFKSGHPTKKDHYNDIFNPTSSTSQILTSLLPYLPEPIPFEPLLEQMRRNIRASLDQGRVVMVGEIGLDGGARCRWPVSGKAVWDKIYGGRAEEKGDGRRKDERINNRGNEIEEEQEQGEWRRLTPFKTTMLHQKAILEAQLEVAIEFGVNVSFHSVSAAGATLDVLTLMRDRHRTHFTNRLNIDLHSCGGLSAPSLIQASRALSNLYFSPSILITGRNGKKGWDAIKVIPTDKLLLESDTHDLRESGKLVWSCAVWVTRCKGWKLEGWEESDSIIEGEVGKGRVIEDVEDWQMDKEEKLVWDEKGKEKIDKEIWTVRTVERNWARFMRLID